MMLLKIEMVLGLIAKLADAPRYPQRGASTDSTQIGIKISNCVPCKKRLCIRDTVCGLNLAPLYNFGARGPCSWHESTHLIDFIIFSGVTPGRPGAASATVRPSPSALNANLIEWASQLRRTPRVLCGSRRSVRHWVRPGTVSQGGFGVAHAIRRAKYSVPASIRWRRDSLNGPRCFQRRPPGIDRRWPQIVADCRRWDSAPNPAG